MTDDFTNVGAATCYALNSSTSFYAYSSGTRTTYYQIGGKWYRGNSQVYNNIPTGTYCYSSLDFNSNAVFEPFLYFVSFCLVCVAVFGFFYVLRRAFYAFKVD